MRVMGIDSDSAFGWALYDTDKPLSAIESGSLELTGASMFLLAVLRHSPDGVARE